MTGHINDDKTIRFVTLHQISYYRTQKFLKIIKLAFYKLDKFYIRIYIFLYIIIIKYSQTSYNCMIL